MSNDREKHSPMGMRYKQPGWTLAAMNDPALRRGLWYRETRDGPLPPNPIRALLRVELCAGREGDDAYVCLEVGVPLDARTLAELEGVLCCGAWMVEDHEDPPGRSTQAVRAQALEVGCSVCNVLPGELCRRMLSPESTSPSEVDKPHDERVDASYAAYLARENGA